MHSLTLSLPSKSGAQKLSGTGTSWEGGKQKSSCGTTLTRVK